MLTKKYDKGYCQPPKKTKKNMVIESDDEDDDKKDNEPEITLENYKPNNCSNSRTPSKGGYKKTQLKKFGINYLKIPRTQLEKENDGVITILPKTELCKIINSKFREIQTQGSAGITDKMRKEAYKKNIDNCPNGEAKGGYSLLELKNLAISYFELSEEKVKDMKKDELCLYITKYLKKIEYAEQHDGKDIDDSDSSDSSDSDDSDDSSDGDGDDDGDYIGKKGEKSEKYNMIYEGDINLCNDTPNRGGLSLKKLKKIAINNFGIDVKSKYKEDICTDIKDKINKDIEYKKEKEHIKNIKFKDSKKSKLSKISKISKLKYSFDDILKGEGKEGEEDEEDEDEDEDEEEEDKFSDIVYSSKNSYSDDDEDD